MKKIIIAIDGPAGSGKTSSAKLIAEKLGYKYIDSGAMYRAVSWAWLSSGFPIDEEFAEEILDNIHLDLQPSENGQKTILNGIDISDDIRSTLVTTAVSPISAMGSVRKRMIAIQREIGKNGGIVMDGRDIGTVVFPQAELKIFFTATVQERAQRRVNELKAKGVSASLEEIQKQITARDNYDTTRELSPMIPAADAIILDTTGMNLETQVETVMNIIKGIMN
ncbi:MAG: (d)CMP kinase [bacterium]